MELKSICVSLSSAQSVPQISSRGVSTNSYSSSNRIGRIRKWFQSESSKVDDPVRLECDIGFRESASFTLDIDSLTFEATIPVLAPNTRNILSCQSSVGIFYKYYFVTFTGSIFNPPRLCLIDPLQMAINIAIQSRVEPSNDPVRYGLLSKARDSLIYFLQQSKPDTNQFNVPEFFNYPYVSSRDNSRDHDDRVSPVIVSPSLRDELVQAEIFVSPDEPGKITILFVPSISEGIAHVVSDEYMGCSIDTDCEYWKIFRTNSNEPESVSLSYPPDDSDSKPIIQHLVRMRELIQHNNRIISRIPKKINSAITLRNVSYRKETYSQIGSFELSECGSVTCLFRDRVRLWFQLVMPAGTIDRQFGSVKLITPFGDTEELTWEFLLGNRHQGWQTYSFYISCALRFLYGCLNPEVPQNPLMEFAEYDVEFDEDQIKHVLDKTNRFIDSIK